MSYIRDVRNKYDQSPYKPDSRKKEGEKTDE